MSFNRIHTILVAAFLWTVGVAPASAASTVYQAASDFGAQNPSGVWSYGYTATSQIGSAFTAFNKYTLESGTSARWNINLGDYYFAVSKNLGSTSAYGIQPGQLALHPSTNLQYTMLRFTAPEASHYALSMQFFVGDTGDTDAYVLMNGNAQSPLFYASTTSTSPSFQDTVWLGVGGFIDVMVGAKGDYRYDHTPINVQIAQVPEPSILASLIAAAMVGRASRRRRKPLR